MGMLEYWSKRADQMRIDIEHVKRQMRSAREEEEVEHLKELKEKLTEELMIAIEAVENFQ